MGLTHGECEESEIKEQEKIGDEQQDDDRPWQGIISRTSDTPTRPRVTDPPRWADLVRTAGAGDPATPPTESRSVPPPRTIEIGFERSSPRRYLIRRPEANRDCLPASSRATCPAWRGSCRPRGGTRPRGSAATASTASRTPSSCRSWRGSPAPGRQEPRQPRPPGVRCESGGRPEGRYIDTAICFTMAAGLVMAPRIGVLDPGLIHFLGATEGMTLERFDHLVQARTGPARHLGDQPRRPRPARPATRRHSRGQGHRPVPPPGPEMDRRDGRRLTNRPVPAEVRSHDRTPRRIELSRTDGLIYNPRMGNPR